MASPQQSAKPYTDLEGISPVEVLEVYEGLRPATYYDQREQKQKNAAITARSTVFVLVDAEKRKWKYATYTSGNSSATKKKARTGEQLETGTVLAKKFEGKVPEYLVYEVSLPKNYYDSRDPYPCELTGSAEAISLKKCFINVGILTLDGTAVRGDIKALAYVAVTEVIDEEGKTAMCCPDCRFSLSKLGVVSDGIPAGYVTKKASCKTAPDLYKELQRQEGGEYNPRSRGELLALVRQATAAVVTPQLRLQAAMSAPAPSQTQPPKMNPPPLPKLSDSLTPTQPQPRSSVPAPAPAAAPPESQPVSQPIPVAPQGQQWKINARRQNSAILRLYSLLDKDMQNKISLQSISEKIRCIPSSQLDILEKNISILEKKREKGEGFTVQLQGIDKLLAKTTTTRKTINLTPPPSTPASSSSAPAPQ